MDTTALPEWVTRLHSNNPGTDALRILYEDNHLLVVEKPPGLLSQSDHTGKPDLLTLAREYIRVKYNKPGEVYLGMVHRLDRAVGGVIIFARTSKAAARLNEQFSARTVKKIYLACVEGRITPPEGERTHWMRKNEATRMAEKSHPKDKFGKEAKLRYRVIRSENHDEFGPVSYVEVELLTGRFHQIRYQLSAMGHPIPGDYKYGSRITLPGGNESHDRLALHAIRLTIKHPTKKEAMTFESPVSENWPWEE